MTDSFWLEFDEDKLAVVDQCRENLEESMGFPCENLIKETAEDILKYRQ